MTANNAVLRIRKMKSMPLGDMFKNAERASRFLKGLANENRLVILCTLAEGEKNVGELEEVLGIRQSALSQQLARLRVDELVSTRRDAKQIYYSLSSKEAEQMMGLLYELFCEDDNDGAKDAVDTTDKIKAT